MSGCAGSSSSPTKVQGFAPQSSSASALQVPSTTTSGYCWEGSLALSQDASAWRCSAANQIMDPCFAPQGQSNPSQLICASAPWAPTTRLSLTQPLPLASANSAGAGPPPVWAVALVNGDRCVVGTGTVSRVGTVVLDYVCTSGSVAGGLDRNRQPWTLQYQPTPSAALRALAVRTAWN